MIDARGMGVVEFDYQKIITPTNFGYRDMNFTLRMPNGLMVEFQAIIDEIAAAKREFHKIYVKWRPYSIEQIVKMGRWEEYSLDRQTSYAGYNNAKRSSLNRLGISHGELIKSLMKDFTTLGLVSTPITSSASAGDTPLLGIQTPSAERKNGMVGVPSSTLLPSRSSVRNTSDNFISTSSDKISQSSDNATFSQGKSDPAAKDFVAGYKESPKIANPLTENCKCQNIYISKNPIASIRNPYLYIAYIITGLFS
jgi:hypothetical protein